MDTRKALPLVVLIYFTIGLAFVVNQNPWFSFTENALSDMGSLKNPKGWIFNLYIIGLGTLGLITAKALKRDVLKIAMLALILVGVFPEEKPLHTPSAVLTYLLSFLDMVLYGGMWRIIGPGTFILMIALIKIGIGLAIPEVIGAMAIITYMIYLGWRE
ncbi:hypothetical protein A3L04_03330 [Thermococcus chitonophagus]|uniref:Uncharacterized protein n=2 Tax=Thermococcus chitonophagus TaxID=54262 RepID=A0A2Z2NEB5_9EURY|nr:DUF998 domain-containing protein [Thermococcus chitonophagus]ASJ16179.1 hypothetical protein A3L04_03330 [Thermococcus chitonophagus]